MDFIFAKYSKCGKIFIIRINKKNQIFFILPFFNNDSRFPIITFFFQFFINNIFTFLRYYKLLNFKLNSISIILIF